MFEWFKLKFTAEHNFAGSTKMVIVHKQCTVKQLHTTLNDKCMFTNTLGIPSKMNKCTYISRSFHSPRTIMMRPTKAALESSIDMVAWHRVTPPRNSYSMSLTVLQYRIQRTSAIRYIILEHMNVHASMLSNVIMTSSHVLVHWLSQESSPVTDGTQST